MSTLKHCLEISKVKFLTPELKADLLAEQNEAIQKGVKNPMTAAQSVLGERLKQLRRDRAGAKAAIMAHQVDLKDAAAKAGKPVWKPELELPPSKAARPAEVSKKAAQSSLLADWIGDQLGKAKSITWRALFAAADKFFDGTQGQGAYTPRDAYDAMELGVNRYILKHFRFVNPNGQRKAPEVVIEQLQRIVDSLPTQSKRTQEQIEFQQFSTPPFLAYAANWVANIGNNDVYLEPSAGIGGLAIFGRMSNAAKIYLNELSNRRAELLEQLNLGEVFSEDAIQLDNILPDHVKPTVIIMNPPFSSTAGRLKRNFTKYGAQHVEQALKRLEPGGRLVAIVGRGMEMQAPTFRQWWTRIRKQYTVLANVGISGEEYRKYGTTFDNRLLVIDKTGPTVYDPVVDDVKMVKHLPKLLRKVRYDRQEAPELDQKGEPEPIQPPRPAAPETGAGTPPGAPSTRPEPPDLGAPKPETDIGAGGGVPGRSPEQPDIAPTGPRGELPGPGEPGEGEQPSRPGEGPPGGAPQRGEREPEQLPPEKAGDLSLDELSDLFDEVLEEEGLTEAGPPKTPVTAPPSAPMGEQPTAPTAKKPKAEPDEYDAIADLMKDAGIKEEQAPYQKGQETAPPLVYPDVYAKAKELLSSAYVKFMEGAKDTAKRAKEWMRAALKSLTAKGLNPDVVKNWVMNFYANDRPDLVSPKTVVAPGEVEVEQAKKKVAELEDKLYQRYTPTVKIKGAKQHPTPLDESAALGDTDPPPTTYKLSLPQEMIDSGKASDAQLEAAVYAGQAHELVMPNGKRRGFFAGHGTGVGKGRIIASVMLDNWNKGRKKAIWISEKQGLFKDAKRDLGYDESRKAESGIGWQEGSERLFNLGATAKTKVGRKIPDTDGIMFTTYATLSKNFKAINEQQSDTLEDLRIRINQIADWAGKDFDGVIAFDESHNMANLTVQQTERGQSKAADMARAGKMLQDRLPKARILYVSATGATEVRNLAYADRLGLWGEGTPFPNTASFITDINARGLSAMELVARDLKSRGLYLAPTLSYDGVFYDKIIHELDDSQRKKYDELAEAWKVVLHNITEAMGDTGADQDGGAKRAMWSQFWGGQQRFFNQLITTMQMGAGIKHMEAQLAAGNALVLQLVNHGGSQLERALEARDEDSELEDLELGPKAALLEYLENAFPTQQYEPYIDDAGNEAMRPMYDSKGKPVINREALRKKTELIARISAIKVPGSPLDLIIHHFGQDKVAEVTGRKRRLVYDLETDELIVEKWSDAKAKKDVEAFMDDEKPILVFSEKGGTGMSYHADLDRANQKKRIHYLVQPGWRADKAIQGLGRTHRSNQRQPPEYFLLTTNLDAQKRFISSIARRLDQLGALTKGQRQTGSQGIFQARDNMESDYASASLYQLFRAIAAGQSSISVQEFQEQTALTLVDEQTGDLLKDLPGPTKFMNRLLTMVIKWQNRMFGEWADRIDTMIDAAAAAGTLDVGIETVTAQSIVKAEDRTVNTDKDTGAKTRYIRLEVTTPSKRKAFEDVANVEKYYVNIKSGKIWGGSPVRSMTRASGNVETYRSLQSPAGTTQRQGDADLDAPPDEGAKWREVSEKEAAVLWNEQYAEASATSTRDEHLMTGALLPIWDRLADSRTVHRLQTDEGERFLGLVVHPKKIDTVLSGLGAEKKYKDYTGDQLAKTIIEENSIVTLVNRWRMKRKVVSGDERIELFGPEYDHLDEMRKAGLYVETIAHKTRFFIPTGENAGAVIEAVIANRPVGNVAKPYAGPKLADQVINEPSDLNKQFGHAKQAQMSLFGGTQLNLFTDVKKKGPPKPQPPASRQNVVLETTGDISHYGTKVKNSEEAAGLVSFLIRKGAEEAYTIATDKSGNVVQIHKVSKGAAGSASVPAVETGGTLLKAPGATTVYFIHQHPSRDPKPSPEDIAISKLLKSVAAMRDIEFKAIIMVDSPPAYTVLNIDKPVVTSSLHPLSPEIKKRVRANLTTKLPVSERFIEPVRGFENMPDISNSVAFRSIIEDQYHNMEGVLLLDGKNHDLGFVPWAKNETMKEFTARLISEADSHNARAAVVNIKSKGKTGDIPKARVTYIRDLVKGMNSMGLIMHDVSVDGVSMADKGQMERWKSEANQQPSGFLEDLIKDTVVFSRKVSKPRVSLSVEDIQANIDPILSEMRVRPPVTVLRRQNSLPEGIRTYLKDNGGENDIIVAAVHNGRVYLVAENIESGKEAIRALLHEVMGHFGIHAVLGDQANSILDSVYIAKRDDISRIATEYGFNLKTASGRRAAADEWLAREAETNPNSKWIDRVIALIRKWLRNINAKLTFSDTEIRALLARSRRYIRTGEKTSVFPTIAFDRKPALADIWHSHMAGVLKETLPNSGTASSYLQMVDQMGKSGKIKTEELEWSGLREWLNTQKGKVSKVDVLAWLEENNVDLQELHYWTDPEVEAAKHLRDNLLTWPEDITDYANTTWANPVTGELHEFEVRKIIAGDNEGQFTLTVDGDTVSDFTHEGGTFSTIDEATQMADDWAEDLQDESIKETAEVDWVEEWDADQVVHGEQRPTNTASWYNEQNGESIEFKIEPEAAGGGVTMYQVYEDGESWGPDGLADSVQEAKNYVDTYLKDAVHDMVMFNEGVLADREHYGHTQSHPYPKHTHPDLQTPGGKNYRELLLRLPYKFPEAKKARITELNKKAKDYKATEKEQIELNRLLDERNKREFVHPHWQGEQNIIAHIRFNERIDRDGRRVLFLEEVQSDWHQKGRRVGYRGVEPPPGYKVFQNENGRWQIEEPDGTIFGGADTRREILEQFSASDAVPDAPFKKSWPILLMKRMVRYAAENDFDSISWTPGQFQNRRYALSRRVKSIEVHGRTDADGKPSGREVGIILKEGPTYSIDLGVDDNGMIDNSTHADFKGKPLADVVGKDIAKRIMRVPPGGKLDIQGPDLDIGGKPMIEFYDKMLPSMINKFFGKAMWGKARVETNVLKFDNAPESVVESAALRDPESPFVKKNRAKVLSLPITPEMKAKALYEGMPLFMKKRQGAIDVVSRLPENVKHRFAQARGVPKVSWIQEAREKIKFVKSLRYHFPDLYTIGNAREEDQLNDILRQHQEVPETAKDQAARKILEFTGGLSQDQYEIFRINLILADMIRDVDSKLLTDAAIKKEGDTLPFGFENVQQIRDTFDTFEQLADQEPSVRKAITDRRKLINGLVRELVKFKLLKKEVLKHKDYFHHQVLAYWAGNSMKTTGASSADVRTHWRPWMAARKGSMMDYNTEYVEAEFAALAQQMAQVETAKTLGKVKNISDIYRDLKTAAKFQNLKNFYVQAAKQASKMFNTKITVAELRADHKLDPLFPYRQNIAMASSQLENMAYKGILEVDSEWDDVVDALAENYEIRKAGEEERGANELADISDARYFGFLTYLIDKRKPGASWAATTFKAIQGRNKHIKGALGDDFITYRNIIPEGYTQWKPEPGKGWFWANTVADDILQKIIAGEKALEDKDVRQMLAKGKDLIWVIPEGLASTMDNFRRYPEPKSLGRIADWGIGAWKIWILINPRRWIRYNLNNMSGDLDISMAYAPGIARPDLMKKALSDLRKWHKRKGMDEGTQAELDMWRRKGVLGSGFAVQEVEDVLKVLSTDKWVREVLLGEKPNVAMRYWNLAKSSTVIRENILRLAAARWFKKALVDGKRVYGASKPHEVDNVKDIDDKAAKLARELIGDYGNISSAGQYIRRRLIPFYSWLEINAPRYVYLMRNLREEDRHSDAIRVRRQVAGIAAKKIAIGGGKLFIKANLLMGAVLLYNMLAHRDEWEELGEAKRRQMHLILGRRDDGTIQTIRFQGALSDALAWFGLEDWAADINDVVKNKATIQDKLIEAPIALATKVIHGIRPEPKLLMESLTGKKTYPDPFNTRPIRDTAEHILRTFSLDSLYRMAAGKPGRGKNVAEHMLSDIKSLLVYTSDPGEQAYYDTRKMVFDWLGDQGIERSSGKPTKRSNALYYYRQALKYGDFKAAKRYLDLYYTFPGATARTLRGSIKRAHPLASIPARKRYSFRQSLGPKQADRLKQALKWYDLTFKEKDLELRHGIKTQLVVNQP